MFPKVIALFLVSSGLSSAAISFTGVGLANLRKSSGIGVVATGSLGLLIVDQNNDGFLGLGATPAFALSPLSDPHIEAASAALTAGSYFGGDFVLATLTAGIGSFNFSQLSDIDIAGLESKNFAVVWLDGVLASSAPSTAPGGTNFGIVTGIDWVLPSVNSSTYQMSPNDSLGSNSYFMLNIVLNANSAIAFRTTTLGGTPAASFAVVPEPSCLMLSAFGCFASVYRRRKQ